MPLPKGRADPRHVRASKGIEWGGEPNRLQTMLFEAIRFCNSDRVL